MMNLVFIILGLTILQDESTEGRLQVPLQIFGRRLVSLQEVDLIASLYNPTRSVFVDAVIVWNHGEGGRERRLCPINVLLRIIAVPGSPPAMRIPSIAVTLFYNWVAHFQLAFHTAWRRSVGMIRVIKPGLYGTNNPWDASPQNQRRDNQLLASILQVPANLAGSPLLPPPFPALWIIVTAVS
jgi:hypothetical protein